VEEEGGSKDQIEVLQPGEADGIAVGSSPVLLPDMLKNAPMFKVGGEGGVVLVELVSIIPI